MEDNGRALQFISLIVQFVVYKSTKAIWCTVLRRKERKEKN